MASGEKKIPAKGKFILMDPNGVFGPTPHGIMWKTKTIIDGNGFKTKVSVPCRPEPGDIKFIGDLSKKINDTKEAEAEIARQKTQEEEKHKVCIQQYEDRIHKLEEELDKISLDIKKKDADNKSAGIVEPRESKDLAEKQQKDFMKRFYDLHMAQAGISFEALVWNGPKEKDPAEVKRQFNADRAAGRIQLGPGVRIVPVPATQPQKRKIDEVYVHDSDDDDVVILGEWPCEKKGTAAQKSQEKPVKMYGEEDPLDESIVEKWMKTWDEYFHHGAPK